MFHSRVRNPQNGKPENRKHVISISACPIESAAARPMPVVPEALNLAGVNYLGRSFCLIEECYPREVVVFLEL
jgi:hypothetical protein